MTRLLRHDAKGPAIVKVGGKSIAICQCGLSKDKPFCDGSHHGTKDEKDGLIYLYDAEGNRLTVDDFFPHPKQVFDKGASAPP